MARIVIIEDNQPLANLVGAVLEEEGHEVTIFSEGMAARRGLEETRADLIILDLNVPGLSGIDLCHWLRHASNQSDVPIVAITGSHETRDRYKMFSEGADDFLTKPFDTFELVLRVRNRLRRRVAEQAVAIPDRSLRVGDIEIDLETHDLRVGSRAMRLTQSEFSILHYLMQRADRPVGVDILLAEALDYPSTIGNPEVVRTHVRNLRTKLEDDPAMPTRLVNLPRLGYMIKSEPASSPDVAATALLPATESNSRPTNPSPQLVLTFPGG